MPDRPKIPHDSWFSPKTVGVYGPVDGMGDKHPDGSYFALVVIDKQGGSQRWLISRGASEQVRDELDGLLGARTVQLPHLGRTDG